VFICFKVQELDIDMLEEMSKFQQMQVSLKDLCFPILSEKVQLTRADFSDMGEWTKYLTHGWKEQEWKKTSSSSSSDYITKDGVSIQPHDVSVLCHQDSSSPIITTYQLACKWYALTDLEYEKQINHEGYAEAVSFGGVIDA
jgi:hypothetical protein